jgi:hypothetical protein
MDRLSTPSSVYNNNDEFDAIDAKKEKAFEEIKALIKANKRSSSSSRRRSSTHASELPSSATSHRHRHHHRREREGQELYTNNRSTTSPSTLASSPNDFKASSPSDMRHLRRQAPQAYHEKLPKLNYENSTSYFESLDTLYYANLKAQGEIKKAKSTLDDLYIGVLTAHEELKKDKSPRPRAHLAVTTLQDGEHEDSTTKMPKPNELQDDVPKFDYIAIPLCGMDDAESTMTFFEDGAATTTTTEPIKEQDLVVSEDDASIFGGANKTATMSIFDDMKTAPTWDSYYESSYETADETLSLVSAESDDLPLPTAFIFGGNMDEKVEHGTFPSTKAAKGVEYGDTGTYISPTPTYDEMPQLPCEESHHNMSDTSDSTIYDIECISHERMSVTTTSPTHESMPHILCEVESLSDSTNHMSESIIVGVSEPQHLVRKLRGHVRPL